MHDVAIKQGKADARLVSRGVITGDDVDAHFDALAVNSSQVADAYSRAFADELQRCRCKICGGPTSPQTVHFPLLESEHSGPGYDEVVEFCDNDDCDGSYL